MFIRSFLGIAVMVGGNVAVGSPANMSFNGYTGYIVVPNAKVMDYRSLSFHHNNNLEVSTKEKDKLVDGHNYLFGFGLHNNFELTGRIASHSNSDNVYSDEFRIQQRDLSANAKFVIPFIPENWGTLAIGIQDIGGVSNKYDAQYIVASKDWNKLSISAGLGRSESAIDRLNGVFAGSEYHLFDWLDVIGEFDGGNINGGFRVKQQLELFSTPFQIDSTVQLYTTEQDSEDSFYWGLGVTLPLGKKYHHDRSIGQNPHQFTPSAAVVYSMRDYQRLLDQKQNSAPNPTARTVDVDQQLMVIEQLLIDIGFENVSVTFNLNTIDVSFENNVFNHNELDGIGVALGIISRKSNNFADRFKLHLLNQGVGVVDISGSLDDYWRFIEHPCSMANNNCIGASEVADGIIVSYPDTMDISDFHNDSALNKSYLRPRLMLYPGIDSGVATEWGVFDYSVNLRAQLELPLWKGGAISSVMQTDSLVRSSDYEEGEVFAARDLDSGLNSLLFHQTFLVYSNLYNMTSIGTVFEDYQGILNDTTWNLFDGNHRIKAEIGRFDHQDTADKRNYSIFSYRYYYEKQDVSFEIRAGEFWEQQSGFIAETKFHFGDSAVSIIYRNVEYQQAGIAIYLPLTPRKEMSPTQFGQIRGREDWRYEVNTIISNNSNFLPGLQGREINPTYNLDRIYLNNGRLTPDYIRHHLYRMRDIYLQYGQ